MPRWLSSLLLVIAFLALAVAAIAPRTVTVNVNTETNIANAHDEKTVNYNHAQPGDGFPETGND